MKMLWVLVISGIFWLFQKRKWVEELAKAEEALKATEEVCDLREEFHRFFTLIPGDLELILKREKIIRMFKRLFQAELKFTQTHLYLDNEPALSRLIRWKRTRLGGELT